MSDGTPLDCLLTEFAPLCASMRLEQQSPDLLSGSGQFRSIYDISSIGFLAQRLWAPTWRDGDTIACVMRRLKTAPRSSSPLQGCLFEQDFLVRTLGSIVQSPEVALTELVANAKEGRTGAVDG